MWETAEFMNAKHVAIRGIFVKSQVPAESICISYCPTDVMLADILTKPLGARNFSVSAPRSPFLKFLNKSRARTGIETSVAGALLCSGLFCNTSSIFMFLRETVCWRI